MAPQPHSASSQRHTDLPNGSCAFLAIITFCAFTLCTGLSAEQLPTKTYTVSNGLPRNDINRIVRDSHGFLWFCTVEGLSRFDGYTFTNYGVKQGMPDRDVRDLIETRSGEYWVATHNGLARFNPNGSPEGLPRELKSRSGKETATDPRFITYKTDWNSEARHVMTLLEDRDGSVWCGTAGGLCRLQKVGSEWHLRVVDLGVPEFSQSNSVTALLQDKTNALWIGTWDGLHRRWPDGRLEHFGGQNGLPSQGEHPLRSLLEDHDGRIWVGTSQGLFLLPAQPDPRQSVVVNTFSIRQGLPDNGVFSLLLSGEKIWVGTETGLAEISSAHQGQGWAIKAYPSLRVESGRSRRIAKETYGWALNTARPDWRVVALLPTPQTTALKAREESIPSWKTKPAVCA